LDNFQAWLSLVTNTYRLKDVQFKSSNLHHSSQKHGSSAVPSTLQASCSQENVFYLKDLHPFSYGIFIYGKLLGN